MAQVPYSSVPDVTPQESAQPSVSARTTSDAFGGAVGAAFSQAGQTIERAGDEIDQRAFAMQQVAEEAKARNAQLTFDQQSAQLQAAFTAKEGLNAGPEALAQHTKDLAALRSQISGSLDSPFAKKTFDADSMPFMGRLIFSAAGHSGQQVKAAYDGGLQAGIQSARDSALQNPSDDLQFRAGLAQTEQDARNFAGSHGYTPEQTEQYVKDQTSGVVASRIEGLARTQPLAARQLLDKSISDGSLRGEDILKVKPRVDAAGMTAGGKMIGDGVRDGSLFAMGTGPVDIERAKDAIGRIESGNTYDRQGPIITSGPYAGQRAQGRFGVMPGNLPQWLAAAGLPQMTPEQFRADPAAQDKVFETQFGGDMKKYGTANDAASKWFTGKPMAQANPNASDGGTTHTGYMTQFNKNLAGNGTVEDQMAAARASAGQHYSDIPLVADAAEQRVLALHRQDTAAAREVQLQNKSVIDGAIAAQRGGQPATLEQLASADPNVARAMQGLDPKGRLAVQRQLTQAQSQDNVPSAERDIVRNQLIGQSYSDPDGFRNTDFYSKNLTADDRRTLIGIAQGMSKGTPRDVHVEPALRTLNTQLEAAGVLSQGKPTDKADYNQFVGSLATEMRTFQQQNARPPTPKDVEDIGRRLLMQQSTPRSFLGIPLGTSQTPTYQLQPPPDFAAKARARYPNLTDDDVRRLYVHSQYRAAVGN